MGVYDNNKGMTPEIQARVDAGIGCGSYILDGWRDIIIQLDKDIAAIDPDYKIDQIKEKFGGLRFYVSLVADLNKADQDRLYRLIHEAEDKTMETCDVCGQPGQRWEQSRGFTATKCKEHEE